MHNIRVAVCAMDDKQIDMCCTMAREFHKTTKDSPTFKAVGSAVKVTAGGGKELNIF